MAGLKWKLLLKRIHEGRCVPFLGAGVNVTSEARGYSGLALGGTLAELLEEAVETARAAALARLALEYEVQTDRDFLLEFLLEALPDEDVEPSPALKVLARLPLPMVVTTNYDRLLERALDGRKFTTLVQPAGGFADTTEVRDRLAELEHYDGTIVYKIHGTFTAGAWTPEPWIEVEPGITITEDDYIQFLTTHDSEAVALGVPKVVKTRLTPSTLLFLGYSLEDWDFRTIYRGLVGRLNNHTARRSFAVLVNPEAFWVDYWRSERIEIVDMDVYDFCDELERRYFEAYPAEAG